jgi:long-chain acyl-CoA synthetase
VVEQAAGGRDVVHFGAVNLAEIIDAHPDDAVALVDRGRPTTYADLRRQVATLRAGFGRLGLEPGDRVALVVANNWYFVVSYLAALGVGAVAVPLNPASAAAELERQLATARARLAVVGPSGRDAFSHVDRAAAGVERVLVPERTSLAGAEPLQDYFDAEPAGVVDRSADDVAALLFTAGTAGASKAAVLTHGNLLANLDQVMRHPGLAARADDVALGVLPLFHIFGLNVVLGLALRAGGTVALVERFDPQSCAQTVREHGVTIVAGAPPMFEAWSTARGVPDDTFRGVRLAVSGGAALPASVAEAFEARFGIPIWEGYGLTEAAPIVSTSLVGGEPRKGSIGVPVPGVEVRLVDAEGEDALHGDPGEIWVRGPNVFPGYWEDEDATGAALTADGWLRTGDIAVVDDDGYLYIVDRAKDLIIVSGFNVFPAEVEEALLEHPEVAAAAVVGVEHPHTGETVTAFVVPEPGRHLEEDEVIEFTAERLARYKCPTKVTFVESLPQGLVGKVLRRALRSGSAPAP